MINLLAGILNNPVSGTWPLGSLLLAIVVVPLFIWYSIFTFKKQEVPHYHKDSKGILHKCYHYCRYSNFGFGLRLTLWFPIEHILWHKLWPFYLLSNWLNIG